MQELTEHPRYREARRHVKQLRGLYTHAAIFLLVNAGLLVLGALTGRAQGWVPWGTAAWGMGLAAHALLVFANNWWLGARWEERKIREYLARRD